MIRTGLLVALGVGNVVELIVIFVLARRCLALWQEGEALKEQRRRDGQRGR